MSESSSAATGKVAFLVAGEGIERVELTHPWAAVRDAGRKPVLVSLKPGQVQTFDHLDKSETFAVDEVVASVTPDEFDALVLPGGVANPDALRMDAAAVAFVKAFMATGKPVASICHAAWALVEADAVKGRTLTSWPSVQTDVRNAGGTWVNREVVVDGNLITSRKPEDLPAFCDALLTAVGAGS